MVEFKKAFVVGWPIEHSRSPLIHNFWIKQYGLSGSYDKTSCEPDNLSTFLKSLDENGLIGGNVTIPHKENAFKIVDDTDPVAKRLGAVNTVWRDGEKLCGSNTDGYGFLANLDDQAPDWDIDEQRKKGALVLGAGGAARGVIQPLLDQKPQQLVVANRTSSKAELLADMFAAHGNIKGMGLSDVNEGFDVIINSTSSGLSGQLPEVSPTIFNSNSVVYDMVYGSGNTVFNQWALDNGVHAAYDGLGMLVGQAAESFMLWRGLRPGTKQILRELRKNLEI